MTDRTVEYLLTLDPAFLPKAWQFVSSLREMGAPVVIVAGGARRNPTEQQRLVAMGRSRTTKSKHLVGKAIDIDLYGVNRNAVPKWFWDAVGPYGESLGMRWGGRWVSPYDPGHFEDTV